jgi:hypothetical protein
MPCTLVGPVFIDQRLPRATKPGRKTASRQILLFGHVPGIGRSRLIIHRISAFYFEKIGSRLNFLISFVEGCV